MLIKTDYEITVEEAIKTAMENDANYNPKSGNILWDLFDIETFMLVRTKDTKENIQEYSAIFEPLAMSQDAPLQSLLLCPLSHSLMRSR